jgi:transcriptional regulator with XRE-family HTH domain
MRLGENIRKIRKAWGLNQDEFAEIFEATRAMISSYEVAGIEPKVSFLLKLYELSGIEMTAICLDDLDKKDIPGTPLPAPPDRSKKSVLEQFERNPDLVSRLEELERISEELYQAHLKKDRQ